MNTAYTKRIILGTAAPGDDVRSEVVPSARRYVLRELLLVNKGTAEVQVDVALPGHYLLVAVMPPNTMTRYSDLRVALHSNDQVSVISTGPSLFVEGTAYDLAAPIESL